MSRTFVYTFDPPFDDPAPGPTIDLDVSDIEAAGIREVLQTAGAPYGAWSILDALLTPTGAGTPFIFREPLGSSREVKVALSGLFGRFVARAYLERYFNLSIFAHLGSRTIDLDRHRHVKIKRLLRGDLPDWLACTADLASLTIAEAKGCHDVGGPAQSLDRAWAQAARIDVTARGRKVTVKRIAIATRWGMAMGGPPTAHLSVRDPIDEGEPLDSDAKDAIYIGLLRVHVANLIRPLGHAVLADALVDLTQQRFARRLEGDLERARALLNGTPRRQIGEIGAAGGLIGGIVTRAGPVAGTAVGRADQEALSRLNLRPVFVGVERDLVLAAINADRQAARISSTSMVSPDPSAHVDRAGGWIIQLDGKRRIVGVD